MEIDISLLATIVIAVVSAYLIINVLVNPILNRLFTFGTTASISKARQIEHVASSKAVLNGGKHHDA
ncbi:hypothetical protein DFX32_RS17535 [Vibrio parahaemolyticus]|uniref:hypothetical protein n=1 Tax=Vibrio harveyi group TaxID=717610 RepID=UPI0005439E5F|nr:MULTISPECIES: hypothetical protein [Vibrio harveyi group]APX10215.1 hypothetical protein BWP24_28905 [Vibrio campbellii]EGQ8101382.1 hypothetical protein [Vibrio parahaemolyticus]EGQ8329928.1 hypothetical protein [Vibrio parahaemolyticus]EGQ8551548.1 hypothetical protein [Vibrio parahaemolyticus]EGQ8789123.1 hypothetical protein [Vibrio parahaemolyticus]